MQTIGQQLGQHQLEVFNQAPSLVSTCALGIELELEGFTDRSIEAAQQILGNLWMIERDGSLRNGGAEFITNGGLGGTTLEDAINRMGTMLNNVQFSDTFRCSTHVHVNMRDFTVNQVVRFILAYTACEPLLFSFCGDYRYASNFCTPMTESIPFHKKLLSVMHDKAVAQRSAARLCNKYTALNVLPLFPDERSGRALGTVEFRGSRAVSSGQEMFQLCNLLLSIKEFVSTFSGDEEAMLSTLSGGLVGTVFSPELVANLYVAPDQMERSMVNAWVLLKSYQKGLEQHAAILATAERMQEVDAMNVPTQGQYTTGSSQLVAEFVRNHPEWNGLTAVSKVLRMERCQVGTVTDYLLEMVQRSFPDINAVGKKNVVAKIISNISSTFMFGNESSAPQLVTAYIAGTEQINSTDYTLDANVRMPQLWWFKSPLRSERLTSALGINASQRLRLSWHAMANLNVRVKNRAAIAERLAELTTANVPVSEVENAARIGIILELCGLPSSNHIWRADYDKYVTASHVHQYIRSMGLAIPMRISPREIKFVSSLGLLCSGLTWSNLNGDAVRRFEEEAQEHRTNIQNLIDPALMTII